VGSTERFTVLMARDERAIRVEEAALLVAAQFRPGLVVSEWLRRIDDLAEGCSRSSLDAIRTHLFDELGFTGNTCEYYDPGNSCLDVVIDSRRGIPITLSALLIAVARRCDRELEGVGMPGHFLALDVESGLYIDAFAGGTVLDLAACRDLFGQLHGPDAPFDESMLAPVGPVTIVHRMLNNLVQIARSRRDLHSGLVATRLRALLPDATILERAELASAYAGCGDFAARPSPSMHRIQRARVSVARRPICAPG
jgi:regulator of sirC expression with transglutaminase-like and TPR domain